MDFTWSGVDFDTNGLFYWLGTNKGTEPWTNPAKSSRVTVSSSGNGEGKPPLHTETTVCSVFAPQLVSGPSD